MITLDSFTQSNGSGSGTGTEPVTFVNGGGFLMVSVFLDSLAEDVTDVTYAGVSLTELSAISVSAGKLWVGYLTHPQTGSHSVDVFFTGSVSAFRVGIASFNSVDQTTPIGGSNSATWEDSTGTPRSVTVTVSGDSGTVVDFFYVTRSDGTGNAKFPQTEIMNNTGTWGGAAGHLAGISYIAHSGSNVTMEWENLGYQSSRADQMIFAVELIPQAASDSSMFLVL
jgi:hypothetical protein